MRKEEIKNEKNLIDKYKVNERKVNPAYDKFI